MSFHPNAPDNITNLFQDQVDNLHTRYDVKYNIYTCTEAGVPVQYIWAIYMGCQVLLTT